MRAVPHDRDLCGVEANFFSTIERQFICGRKVALDAISVDGKYPVAQHNYMKLGCNTPPARLVQSVPQSDWAGIDWQKINQRS